MATISPRTVLVTEDPTLRYFVWRCSCGEHKGSYNDERSCRDDGLRHQQSHIAEPSMRRRYKASTAILGPKATVHDAHEHVLAECREQDYEPLPDTVHAEEVMPPVTATVVRRWTGSGRRRRSETVDIPPGQVTGLVMRWNHSVHEGEVVGTRWTGWVDVTDR